MLPLHLPTCRRRPESSTIAGALLRALEGFAGQGAVAVKDAVATRTSCFCKSPRAATPETDLRLLTSLHVLRLPPSTVRVAEAATTTKTGTVSTVPVLSHQYRTIEARVGFGVP
jgi:hypothetical protein